MTDAMPLSDPLAERRESRRPVSAMMRVRLKADGRIVEILPDGSERAISRAHQEPDIREDAAYARSIRARSASVRGGMRACVSPECK